VSAAPTGRAGAEEGWAEPPPLAYELRIGVTGHRALDDPSGIEQAVRDLLRRLAQTFESASAEPRGGHGAAQARWRRLVALLARALRAAGVPLPVTPKHVPPGRRTPIEWTVVSALARGADRLVAGAVLDLPGARLEALLPFPQEEYERDFTSPEDLAEFRRLRALARSADVVSTAPGARDDPGRRAEAYYRAGQAVVDASEIVVAIWDGASAAGHGGTAEIVWYALQRERVVLWIDAGRGDRPARLLRPRRPADRGGVTVELPAAQGAGGSARALTAVAVQVPLRARELSANFHQLAAYNRDTAFDPVTHATVCRRNVERLTAEPCPLDGPGQEVLRAVLPHYARADQLAITYQWLYTKAAAALFRLSATAVTLAVGQALFLPSARWPIVLEIIAMLLVVLLLGLSREGAWHEKWLQSRHLAEQLRVAFFSHLAGVHTVACHVRPVSTLPFYRGPDTWVFAVVDRVLGACPRLSPPADDWPSTLAFLATKWIAAQQHYHEENHARRHRDAHRTHVAGLWFFGGTLVAATLHVLDVAHHVPAGGGLTPGAIDAVLVACAVALPAWGAASHAINALLERDRIAARSRQMARVLGEIATGMSVARDREEFRAQAERARDVMLTETHEWLVSLSFRGPVLPA
jgi:hypothetical protein